MEINELQDVIRKAIHLYGIESTLYPHDLLISFLSVDLYRELNDLPVPEYHDTIVKNPSQVKAVDSTKSRTRRQAIPMSKLPTIAEEGDTDVKTGDKS